jgi:hypothetical protein
VWILRVLEWHRRNKSLRRMRHLMMLLELGLQKRLLLLVREELHVRRKLLRLERKGPRQEPGLRRREECPDQRRKGRTANCLAEPHQLICWAQTRHWC